VARKHGKPIVVMEPVKGGILANLPKKAEDLLKQYHTDMSVPSWAVRFAASHEGILTVLSGMSDMQQLQDNISYMNNFEPLVQDEYDIIQKVVGIINETIAIPCTACGYCVEGCPQNIAIPKYFELYNAQMQHGVQTGSILQKLYYRNYTQRYGRASECIDCRQCESHCPQHIEIAKSLKDVAAVFEKQR
jgi:predicted aldo/keto reductase-like oxidoreductase